jgi:hypothetical protein
MPVTMLGDKNISKLLEDHEVKNQVLQMRMHCYLSLFKLRRKKDSAVAKLNWP